MVQTISLVLVFILPLLLLVFPFSCADQQPPSSALSKAVLRQDKMRLGSRPPSCYNRCNHCHPCMAVQVPTFPIKEDSEKPDLGDMQRDEKYTNYKALGWKCRCEDHFFNP